MRAIPVFLLLSVVVACATTSPASGPPPSVQACLDVLSALASAYDRCGTNYDQAYTQQLQAIANGDCNNIVGVRDADALDTTCIPSLRTIACTELVSGNLDPTCQLQLQRAQ
jgi:hypothetical protein